LDNVVDEDAVMGRRGPVEVDATRREGVKVDVEATAV
jgi:hypothetical protein